MKFFDNLKKLKSSLNPKLVGPRVINLAQTINWGRILVGCFLLLITAPLIWVGVLLFNIEPEPFEIDLSKFPGRIYKEENIQPGTFLIKNVYKVDWGNDAILRYGANQGLLKEGIAIEIWEPDKKTNGVYQYTENQYFPPKSWIFSIISNSNMRLENRKIITEPEGGILLPCLLLLVGVLVVIAFLVGLRTIIRAFKPDFTYVF